MYSSRDNWERLVTAVVRKQQIWELFHSHSRTPSISTIDSSDDDNDHFNQQLLDSNRWAASTSGSPQAPLQLNNPPSASQDKSGGANITRKLFPANWYRGKKTKQEYSQMENIPGVGIFSLNELKIATDNFADRNILFKNGSAVLLYKGRLENGSIVAVKRFKQLQYFRAEVEAMSNATNHPNLLRLIGVCITQKEKMLVYPYMANRNVASCLRARLESKHPLDWPVRKRIAMGVARGLAHLHDECPRKIIHRNVKAVNIFLNEDFDAIISNFDLAILMDHGVTHLEEVVSGTVGHIAPEYLSEGICSEKIDVYSYGVFLLELITGRRAFDLIRRANDEAVVLLEWVKRIVEEKERERIVDPDIRGNYYYIEQGVEEMIKIALICTQNNPEKRPKMSEIVRIMLQLGDGLVLSQRWEEFCNEEKLLRQEFMMSSDEKWDLKLPDSPRQSDELSSPR
ncbi:hypothetical protein ABFS82_07G098100 [Erythranthe guttata]